jgi:catechol 2,3-dioxygenase-like lactoylglutathione lyase family enzyme
VDLELSMVILEVADLDASLAFYRRLGLDIADPEGGRPLVIHRMPSGVSLLLTTGFAGRYDADWRPASGGYGQLLEFYVGDDAVVDAKWHDLVDAGYRGRMAPAQTTGPYAAMVDDPDGNVILLTSDEAAAPSSGSPSA